MRLRLRRATVSIGPRGDRRLEHIEPDLHISNHRAPPSGEHSGCATGCSSLPAHQIERRPCSSHFPSSQGLIVFNPTAVKGFVSRVATIKPRTAAIAAICPSATPIPNPTVLARPMQSAYSIAAGMSNGSTLVPNSISRSLLNDVDNESLRRPAGRFRTPESNSARLVAVRKSVSARWRSNQFCTAGSGFVRRGSETTLVSRIINRSWRRRSVLDHARTQNPVGRVVSQMRRAPTQSSVVFEALQRCPEFRGSPLQYYARVRRQVLSTLDESLRTGFAR